jgi:hypothetical protein
VLIMAVVAAVVTAGPQQGDARIDHAGHHMSDRPGD